MKSIGVVSQPVPQKIVVRRGNTLKLRFYGYDSADAERTPVVDMSTWTFEGGLYTLGGDPVDDMVLEWTVTMESDTVALLSLAAADTLDLLEAGQSYDCFARYRTVGDAIVKTILVATVSVEGV